MGKGSKNMKKTFFIKGLVLILLGVGIISWGLINDLNGSWFGFGGGLLGIGLASLIRCFIYVKDKEYLEKVEIETHDERNIQIAVKSGNAAFRIGMLIFCILELFLFLLGYKEIGLLIGMLLCLNCVIYFVLFKYYQRKI